MRRGEPDARRVPGVESVLPACRAEAPAIARPQPLEAELRNRCRQIVARRLRKREKFGVDPRAHGMHADILRPGVAAPVAIEAGQRLGAAFAERLAEDILRRRGPSAALET